MRNCRKHAVSRLQICINSHNALRNVLGDANYRIDEAFVLNNGNLGKDGRIMYMPVYMAMFLSPDKLPEKLIYRV